MAILNRKKPYATVHGGNYPYVFEQNHKFFNENGDEVLANGELAEKEFTNHKPLNASSGTNLEKRGPGRPKTSGNN